MTFETVYTQQENKESEIHNVVFSQVLGMVACLALKRDVEGIENTDTSVIDKSMTALYTHQSKIYKYEEYTIMHCINAAGELQGCVVDSIVDDDTSLVDILGSGHVQAFFTASDEAVTCVLT